MDWQGFDRVAVELDAADLPRTFDKAMGEAEKAYQANRKSISLIDRHNDEVLGEKELQKVIAGIEAWMTDVEDFWNAASEIAERVAEALHEGGRDDTVAPDSAAHGDDGEGDEGIAESAKGNGPQAAGRTGRRETAAKGQVPFDGGIPGGCRCGLHPRIGRRARREVSVGGL